MRPVFNSKEYEKWVEYFAIASDKTVPIRTRKMAKRQYDRLTRRGLSKAKLLEAMKAEQEGKKGEHKYVLASPAISSINTEISKVMKSLPLSKSTFGGVPVKSSFKRTGKRAQTFKVHEESSNT